MNTRNLPGGEGRPVRKADNLTAMARIFGETYRLHLQVNQARNQETKKSLLSAFWYLLGLIFYPESGDDMYIRNYTLIHHIRPHSLELLSWEPQIQTDELMGKYW
jgi:hypothetical protein